MESIEERPPPLGKNAPELLLTVGEVAALCKISKQTVYRAAREGRLKAVWLHTQTMRFTLEDVRAWIDASRR